MVAWLLHPACKGLIGTASNRSSKLSTTYLGSKALPWSQPNLGQAKRKGHWRSSCSWTKHILKEINHCLLFGVVHQYGRPIMVVECQRKTIRLISSSLALLSGFESIWSSPEKTNQCKHEQTSHLYFSMNHNQIVLIAHKSQPTMRLFPWLISRTYLKS